MSLVWRERTALLCGWLFDKQTQYGSLGKILTFMVKASGIILRESACQEKCVIIIFFRIMKTMFNTFFPLFKVKNDIMVLTELWWQPTCDDTVQSAGIAWWLFTSIYSMPAGTFSKKNGKKSTGIQYIVVTENHK